MTFAYTYRSSDGQRHSAEIEAESRDAAFAKVRSELGIKPIKVTAVEGESRQDGGSPYGRAGARPSRAIPWGAAILAAFTLSRHHLDRLDAKFGPYLGKRRIAALGLDLRRVPLPIRRAVCVGELHLFLLTPLRHVLRCGTLPTELVKGFISSRTVLPTRSEVLGRKVWDLFFFTVRR